MELSFLLLTGSLSGLVSILGHSVFWSAAELFRPPNRETYANLPVLEVILHMLCGVGLGCLFWLSWGLAAIVDVPWWQRGLIFSAICFGVLVLPVTITLTGAMATSQQLRRGQVVAIVARWLTTCLVAGLAFAWSWARRM